MRQVSFAYFDRPLEEKIKLRMPPDRYRGYISLGSEALAYSLDEESPPDFKESFSIGPVDPPDDAYHRAAGAGKIFCAQPVAGRARRLSSGLGSLLPRDGAGRRPR